ncbi:tyrosine-type recombinase/integrase [Ktedonobacter racemifer]|uniref:Integrase family protein n=1 Tax=Ktedonobacter racemifer DSM 44963 TaxID=485913 RepID=D6U1R1_KTERA|nr:tyrosine-type recombinase/integrase [Ktedonobacter racemifer]EFH82705.1 integrase family protein [Ktedonobacter racemifer DSM 44963]
MHRTPATRLKAIVLAPPMAATMQNVAGQLAPSSRKTYTIDAKHFAHWLAGRDLSLTSLNRDNLVAYRTHLAETYAQSTAARMWAVARRLLDEAVQRGLLLKNPAEGVRGFKTGDDESPHALKREEAKALLDAIDRRTALGKRDNALLMLLLRTGIRRAEAVALTIGDLMMEQGYHIVIIRHGKGKKRGLAKLPVEVRQAIDDYLEAVGRACAAPEAPLFISFRKGDHPQERPLHPNQVGRIVKQRAQVVGIVMSPHGMRASFITLAFEGGADLALVQDGARHKDPRTTRRYQKRRNNLHKNAVDFVWPE